MPTPPTSWPAELNTRYDFVEEAGRGGMGVVYKARDRETGELVAVKVLKADIAADRASSERFINEVRLSRRITHKNVCRVYDFSRAGATAFLTMEYVEGESVRAILARLGPVTVRKGIQIARQMCAGLHEAHVQGIVHRDLKPENVMLDHSGNVKIMDFGIARLLDTAATATVGILGTPAYMAPEQAEGREVDARTDIYAVGLILYELFTGRAAFSGDTPVAVALKQIRETPAAPRAHDPALPPALDAIIMRALEKDPAARFQTIEELDAALAAVPIDAMTTAPGTAAAGTGARWPAVAKPDTRVWTRHLASIGTPSRRVWLAAAALVLLALGAWGAYETFWRTRPEVPYTSFTLDNGLQVLLAEDHSVPTIGVAVTYKVGSRDDRAGRAGFAHFFEHMMFNGSLNVGKGEHQALVFNQGGSPNGVTREDATQFWQTLPANQLDLALFLEADRMRSLQLDAARFEMERSTVMAEIQQRVENAPYGRVPEAIYGAAYDIPGYKRYALGSRADLQAATLQEVADFFRIFYAPNNAVLSIAGDFDPRTARERIEHYFEHIPAQPPAPVPDLTEPPQQAERRVTLEDPFASLPLTLVVYKAPPGAAPEWETLHVLMGLIGDGLSSRLQRKLVRELEVAASANAATDQRAGPGLLSFSMTPARGKDAATLLRHLDQVLEEVRTGGVSREEVDRARTRLRLVRASALQQNAQRALLLGEYQAKYGDLTPLDLRRERLAAVTPEAVQQAAATWLVPERRTVLVVTPGDPSARPAVPPAPATPREALTLERLNRAPVSRDVLRVSLPEARPFTLDNGLTVQVAEHRRVPLVSVRFDVRGAGPLHAPRENPALSHGVSAMLREGTPSRTSRQIGEDLDALGVTVTTGPSTDGAVSAVVATGLSDSFAQWLPIVADLVLNPTFPADELTIIRSRLAAEWRARRTSGSVLAAEAFEAALHGGGLDRMVQPEDFARLTPDALRAWHRERYVPQHVTMTVAGAVDRGEVEDAVKSLFGGWQRTAFAAPPLPPPAAPGTRAYVIARPGSVQGSVVAGVPAPDRLSADYLPLVALNRVLGATASSRLFVTLREERGYTYGTFSFLNAHRHGGDWRATADMDTSRAGEAMTALVEEMRRMATEPVPAQEFEEAKRSIVASFAITLEQLIQIVSYMNTRQAYNFSADYWERYPEKLMAVTAADAQQAAAKYMDLSKLQIVAVGEPSALSPVLATFAPVTVHDATGKPAAAAPATRRP